MTSVSITVFLIPYGIAYEWLLSHGSVYADCLIACKGGKAE
jgi:hypothetical protein